MSKRDGLQPLPFCCPIVKRYNACLISGRSRFEPVWGYHFKVD